MTSAYLLKLTE